MKKANVRKVKQSKVTRTKRLKTKLKSLKLTMPRLKRKGHSGTKDRLQQTPTGKIIRRHAATNHLQSKQTNSNQRSKKGTTQLTAGMKKKHKKAL